MKITIESTTNLVNVNGCPARVWQGLTESGIVVSALVVGIGAEVEPGDPRADQISRELHEHAAPLPVVGMMFPDREMLFGVQILCADCGARAHVGECGPPS